MLDDIYHHNHHKYPDSFRFSVKPEEPEVFFPIFKVLKKIGVNDKLNDWEENTKTS